MTIVTDESFGGPAECVTEAIDRLYPWAVRAQRLKQLPQPGDLTIHRPAILCLIGMGEAGEFGARSGPFGTGEKDPHEARLLRRKKSATPAFRGDQSPPANDERGPWRQLIIVEARGACSPPKHGPDLRQQPPSSMGGLPEMNGAHLQREDGLYAVIASISDNDHGSSALLGQSRAEIEGFGAEQGRPNDNDCCGSIPEPQPDGRKGPGV